MACLTSFKDERRMAKFAQYGIFAAQEALEDAVWNPQDERDREMTVCYHLLRG